MAVRQYAYLIAPIKRTDEGEDPSRADEMGEYTPWPDFGPGKYLHEAMMALGPTRAQPMGGYRAADWPEIVAYSQACGPFERWELELLRDMCVAFVDGLRIGANPMGKPPIEF